MSQDVHKCTHWLRPRNPPPPPPAIGHDIRYTRALLVSKDRRHLLVIPWGGPSVRGQHAKTPLLLVLISLLLVLQWYTVSARNKEVQ
jgi:hypothetical protein